MAAAGMAAAVLAGAGLQQRRSTLAAVPPSALPVSAEQAAASTLLPLDAHGVGLQILDTLALQVRVAPYPVRAGRPMTVALVPMSLDMRSLLSVTPTLTFVSPEGAEAGRFALVRSSAGAYQAAGIFAPRPGRWQLSLEILLSPSDAYRTAVSVEAR
jgi:hypothetical protein